jgi:hypothetical protein
VRIPHHARLSLCFKRPVSDEHLFSKQKAEPRIYINYYDTDGDRHDNDDGDNDNKKLN